MSDGAQTLTFSLMCSALPLGALGCALRFASVVFYDYWIAAVRIKLSVRIFAAIKYSITPVVLDGMWPLKDISY